MKISRLILIQGLLLINITIHSHPTKFAENLIKNNKISLNELTSMQTNTKTQLNLEKNEK